MLHPLMSLSLQSVLSRLIASSRTFIHLLRESGYPQSFSPEHFLYFSTYLKSGFPMMIILLLSQCYQAHLITSTQTPFPFLLTKFWVITTLIKNTTPSLPPPHTHATQSFSKWPISVPLAADYFTVSWEEVAQLTVFFILYLSYFLYLYPKKAISFLLNFHCLIHYFFAWKCVIISSIVKDLFGASFLFKKQSQLSFT